jgi:L-ascorbate metabolism protein UlaG (beta-lactamase superfamily)
VAIAAAALTGPFDDRALRAESMEPNQEMEAQLQWIGGPTALLRIGGFTLLTDPMLGPKGPKAFVLSKHPSTGEANAFIERFDDPADVDVSSLDAVLLSHPHADHLDAAAVEAIPKSTLIVVPPTAEAGLRQMGFTNVQPLRWGRTMEFTSRGGGKVAIAAVEAHHAHDAELNRALGEVNGYVLRFTSADSGRGYTVYWTGDSVLYDAITKAVATEGIDLLVAHLGAVGADGPIGRRSMDASEAIQLFKALQAKLLVPIHHSTFGHYREPIERLHLLALEQGLSGIRILKPGERLKIP